MLGITSYGAYVPLHRLSRAELGRAWGGGGSPGEKAVANYDEDSITMAVAAGIDCLADLDRQQVDRLFLVTTTSPYKEKQAAAVVAAALDLRRDIVASDITNSLRSGSIALKLALDSVKAGSAKQVLITAADCRLGYPQSEFEQNFGDGAASIMIGDSNPIATVEASHSHTNEFVDLWRIEEDTYVRSWEDRFIYSEGYQRNVQEAVEALLKQQKLTPKDFAKAVIYAPDGRRHAEIVRALGFDPKSQVPDPLFNSVGSTGAALGLMMLVAALETSKPGDRILFVNYGDGADAFILKVTEEIEKARQHRGIKGHLTSKRTLPNYEKYLRTRQMLAMEAARRPADMTSAVMLWRDRKMIFSLYGVKCKACGRVQFPPQRVCVACRTKDKFEDIRLSDKKGMVFTFCLDNLAPTVDPPLVKAIVDFEVGGRISCHMTDRDPEAVKIGMPVEMTFRRIHDAAGIHNYFWKARPIR